MSLFRFSLQHGLNSVLKRTLNSSRPPTRPCRTGGSGAECKDKRYVEGEEEVRGVKRGSRGSDFFKSPASPTLPRVPWLGKFAGAETLYKDFKDVWFFVKS